MIIAGHGSINNITNEPTESDVEQ